MTNRILIPANLREFTSGQSAVEVTGENVGEALRELSLSYPPIHGRLLTDSGQLHSFVNLFVNGHSIRDLDGLDTKLVDGGTLLIVPALAGG